MQKKTRGRPSYKPTEQARLMVRALRVDNRTQEEIAQALSISIDTLQRHYAVELAAGDITLRAEILLKLASQARKGNVSSARLFITMTSKAAAQREAKQAEDEIFNEKPKPKALGKKEQAVEDALTAGEGSDWGNLLNPDAIENTRPN